jgi:hypothetical protein
MRLSNSRDLAIYMAYFANAGGGGDENYGPVYDAFTTKPSASVQAAQLAMVNSLVDAGVWDELDVLYIFAAHTNGGGEALINWKAPGTNNATAYNTPAFEAYKGFTGNGSNAYIDTGYNPSTEGDKYTLNDCGFGLWIQNNIDETSYPMGCRDGSTYILFRPRASNVAQVRCNTSGSMTWSENDSNAFFHVNRTANNAYAGYRNNNEEQTDTDAATTVPSQNVYALAYNLNGSPSGYSNHQLSALFLGGAMDNTQRAALYNALNTYLTAVEPPAPGATSYMEDSEGNRVKDSEGNDIIIP